MFSFEEEANVMQDREDLISVLRMRFGDIHPTLVEKVYELKDVNTIERLILVAANSPSLQVFLEELEEEGGFRIVGDRFNPIGSFKEGGF